MSSKIAHCRNMVRRCLWYDSLLVVVFLSGVSVLVVRNPGEQKISWLMALAYGVAVSAPMLLFFALNIYTLFLVRQELARLEDPAERL